MNDDRKTKKVYEGELEGKRPRGRPRRNGLTILNEEKLLNNYLHMILLLFMLCIDSWMTSSYGDSHLVID